MADRVTALIGFGRRSCRCAKRRGESVPELPWQRPRAKTLVKLLAASPGHALHREQILDLLWPDADVAASSKLLTKALHFARHALEPDLERGASSRYLRLAGDILSLDPEQAWIDADALVGGTSGTATKVKSSWR